ncbi:MAG: FG-GAP repeat domain-containing protein [Thermoleophilia bacterium]
MDNRPHTERHRFKGALCAALFCLLVGVEACGGTPGRTLQGPAAPPTAYDTAAAPFSRESDRAADLDADGTNELIWLGRGSGAIRIVDGPVTYQARAKWMVREATIGDTDRDGLPEIVALLEDAEGVHVGLFAWRRDRYRERLVTSPIVPPPTSLMVRDDSTSKGDVIELGETDGTVSTYRWNGFGYTIVERAGAGR